MAKGDLVKEYLTEIDFRGETIRRMTANVVGQVRAGLEAPLKENYETGSVDDFFDKLTETIQEKSEYFFKKAKLEDSFGEQLEKTFTEAELKELVEASQTKVFRKVRQIASDIAQSGGATMLDDIADDYTAEVQFAVERQLEKSFFNDEEGFVEDEDLIEAQVEAEEI